MSKDRIYTILSRKLTGEATPAELSELDDLIKSYPDSHLPAQIVEEFWEAPSEQDADFLEATYYLHLQRLKQKEREVNHPTGDETILPSEKKSHKKLIKQLVWLASLIACITLIGVFFYFNNKNTKSLAAVQNNATNKSEVSTKNGSRTKIQLPDGTMVWLNGNSKLAYDNIHFGEGIREVTLIGEGYFDVVKNKEKPFIIHTAKMDIKVVGTSFNVKCYPDEKNTETSLIRGSIEVTLKNRKEKIMLAPSEKLVISNDDPANVHKLENDNKQPRKAIASKPFITLQHLTIMGDDSVVVETAWVQNRLVFSSETFEDVAQKMEKWYGMHISFTNKKIRTEKLTGSFEKETVNEALSALQLTTHFKYKINNDTIIISN